MTEIHALLDRYCTCKSLCVWIPMDVGSFVRTRPFQAYCPSCKIIVNEYYEKNEHNALMLTPKVAFEMFKKFEAKDAEIARLRVALERASDFANSHSLPCLSDIVDAALEAK